MMEAAVVLVYEIETSTWQPVWWHVPELDNPAYIPDSRVLWEKIWDNRHQILAVAHSHPGSGPPSPSHEDVTTFAAVDAALGKRVLWFITSSDHLVLCLNTGEGKHDYRTLSGAAVVGQEDGWVANLREISEYKEVSDGR